MPERKLKDFLKASYLPQKEAAKFINEKYGYEYDPNLSSMQTKVFLSPGTQEAIIAHRGSKRIIDDWINTNIPLAIGLEGNTKRFQEAKSTIQRIREQYPNYKTISTGHSLAGALARNSDSDFSVSYNPGIGIGSIGTVVKPNEKIYRTKGDVVSALSNVMFGNRNENVINSLNPLTIHSYHSLPDDVFF
jgi:hypothetical protein